MEEITRKPTHEEHAEQRALIAHLWGEPLDTVKGTMYHYDNHGEAIRLFMPFAERETPSVKYRYIVPRGGGKVTVRQTRYRTQLAIDVPTRMGCAALEALYHSDDTRDALNEAFENRETESTTYESIA